jgi:hypothetical protein
MALNISDALAAAMLASLSRLNNGYLRIYDGTQPANVGVAISSQVLLAELRFGSPAFVVTNNVATANTITQDSDNNATGTATWCRCLQSDGATAEFDGDVGTAGAFLNLNSTAIQIHAVTTVDSCSITLPKGA